MVGDCPMDVLLPSSFRRSTKPSKFVLVRQAKERVALPRHDRFLSNFILLGTTHGADARFGP